MDRRTVMLPPMLCGYIAHHVESDARASDAARAAAKILAPLDGPPGADDVSAVLTDEQITAISEVLERAQQDLGSGDGDARMAIWWENAIKHSVVLELRLIRISRDLAEQLDAILGVKRVELAPDKDKDGVVSYVITTDGIGDFTRRLHAIADPSLIAEWDSVVREQLAK